MSLTSLSKEQLELEEEAGLMKEMRDGARLARLGKMIGLKSLNRNLAIEDKAVERDIEFYQTQEADSVANGSKEARQLGLGEISVNPGPHKLVEKDPMDIGDIMAAGDVTIWAQPPTTTPPPQRQQSTPAPQQLPAQQPTPVPIPQPYPVPVLQQIPQPQPQPTPPAQASGLSTLQKAGIGAALAAALIGGPVATYMLTRPDDVKQEAPSEQREDKDTTLIIEGH